MWGRLRGLRSVRPWVGALMLLSLAGCASQRVATSAATPAAAPEPVAERDATGAYRFNMTQHGRRMSADEFDAWMKARGIRVAKGAPAATGKPAPQVARAGKAKPSTAKAVAKPVSASAKVAPGKVVASKAAPSAAAAKANKTAAHKPKSATPAQPVETASLQTDKPKAKPVKRGEG